MTLARVGVRDNTRRPKLLVIIGTLAHMGGAERQALYLVEHLVNVGANVDVLAFENGDALRPALNALGVKVHVSPYYFLWPKARRAAALAKLAWMIRSRIRPAALLPFVGIHSKTIAQVWPYAGARFCWWNQQDEGRDLGGTEVERRMLQRVSVITSNSEAGRRFLSSTYRVAPTTILVYNNGTPLPAVVDEGGIRQELGLGSRRIVSMIANITAFKDHATLIDAWALVRKHYPTTERPALVLAGHLRDKPVVTRLKLQAFDQGLSTDDVVFSGPIANVEALIAASDLVVHSSLTEGCPNAICEAMASGRPVVATDIPGSRQALGVDGEAFLAPPRDAQGLAHRIIAMLDDDALRANEGKRNRQRIVTDFSIARMNSFFQDLIEKGLGSSIS